jgi:hypothetical protein
MSRLVWNLGDKKYEQGLDHGVLYVDGGSGVSWNGLISIEETVVGRERTSLYFEGTKYMDYVTSSNYQATVQAFSAPREFGECVGDKSIFPGFVLTRQPRLPFNFSYRTQLGEDGYKIHLVYNALATPTSRGYLTVSNSPSPTVLSWKIDAVPLVNATHKGSAHYIVDSTKTDPILLANLEDRLYGTLTTEPSMPSFEELMDIVDVSISLITEPLAEFI